VTCNSDIEILTEKVRDQCLFEYATFWHISAMPRLSRADRLDLLTRLLRDRPGATTADLAGELGVSPRSLFRDLDALRERGLPVESSRGRGGGLRVNPSWGVGRVLFSRDEAISVLIGLAIAEKLGFPLFGRSIRRARVTITDAFPSHERRRIAPLRDRIFIGTPASARVRESYRFPAAAAMAHVEAAFVEERRLDIEYLREDGTASRRVIEPHALVINAPAWYVIGLDLSRAGTRTFRLDRVKTAAALTDRFRAHPRSMVADLTEAGVLLEHL
jgi:predicted DNA-binding transcriptional regulator YafY